MFVLFFFRPLLHRVSDEDGANADEAAINVRDTGSHTHQAGWLDRHWPALAPIR